MEYQQGYKEQQTGNLGSGTGDKAQKCQIWQIVAQMHSASVFFHKSLKIFILVWALPLPLRVIVGKLGLFKP